MQDTKQQDKKEDILDVAERLFAEHGFEAVSVREISKAADINIAMVSYYFGSKEKLYEEVVHRKLISSESIVKFIEHHSTYQEKLFAIVDLFINKFFERRHFQNIIFREMAMNQRTAMTELITTRVHQNFSVVYDVIEKGIKHKEFNKVDVELTVMTIIGVVKTYTTSGTIACKVLKIDEVENVYTDKFKARLKKHLRELLTNHLGIK
ncbi:MAG TPA: TetR family transcriptional regulator [Chitinophagales bacterium]|jgi:AcrR family transcriptional regulator|nr:TetR family transcriptional regulator [Chitinophagales bacterium]